MLVIIVVGAAIFFLTKVMGGGRELANATDAGAMNIAKNALRTPSKSVLAFTNPDIASNFAVLVGPTNDINLMNYNRLVAHALQISRNTVYSRLRLARSKLVECFSERSPAQLPALLHAARQQGQPTREHQQRTWAVLAAGLPIVEPIAATPVTPTAGAGWIATGKAALVSVSLAAATLGVIGAVGRSGMRAEVERPVPAVSRRHASAPSLDSAAAPVPPAGIVSTSTSTPTPATVPASASAPPRSTPVAGEAAAERERRLPSGGAPSASPPGLGEDVVMLKQAALQLERGEPREALATLDRHALAHPDSTLAPERLGLRVRALCATGQVTEAQALAARHVAEHPGSPLALKLASPCAGAGAGR